MPLLVESLRAVDGAFEDLGPHVERMVRTRRALFGLDDCPDLAGALGGAADRLGAGTWKVRVLYDMEIHEVEAEPYEPRPYRSAALVEGRNVSYEFKTVLRPELDALTEEAAALGADTAIIVRDGLITDFTYANAAFYDGSEWWTPARPLLEGTRRARLLAAGRLKPIDIRADGLREFTGVSPINAMLDLGEVILSINRIINHRPSETAGQSGSVSLH